MILFAKDTRGNLTELETESWQEGVTFVRRRAKLGLQPVKLPSSFRGRD